MLLGPSDRDALWRYLREIGGTALAYFHKTATPTALPGLAELENVPIAWLVREADIDQVSMIEIPSRGYWIVDQMNSPVIELSGGRSELDSTSCGRMYYMSRHLQDGAWADFDTGFVAFGEALWKWVRRSFVRDARLGCWCGPEASRSRT